MTVPLQAGASPFWGQLLKGFKQASVPVAIDKTLIVIVLKFEESQDVGVSRSLLTFLLMLWALCCGLA